jgi:hypothetical protein
VGVKAKSLIDFAFLLREVCMLYTLSIKFAMLGCS